MKQQSSPYVSNSFLLWHNVFLPAAESTAPLEQPFHFPPPQPVGPEERLRAVQPITAALGEVAYNELLDLNNATDEAAIFNHLLEIPGICDLIYDQSFNSSMAPGFEQGPDANATFVAMDVNQNFGSYTQDFSHYNDMQFNMLVENHAPQSEAQDCPSSSMVQVKTEEDLWGGIMTF